MAELIERNSSFIVEKMELQNLASKINSQLDARTCIMHLRAVTEGVIVKHFGSDIIEELFQRCTQKAQENSDRINSSYKNATQLFIV